MTLSDLGCFLVSSSGFLFSFPIGLGLKFLLSAEHVEWKRREPRLDVWDFQLSRKIEPRVNIVLLYIDLCFSIRPVFCWLRLDLCVTNTPVNELRFPEVGKAFVYTFPSTRVALTRRRRRAGRILRWQSFRGSFFQVESKKDSLRSAYKWPGK